MEEYGGAVWAVAMMEVCVLGRKSNITMSICLQHARASRLKVVATMLHIHDDSKEEAECLLLLLTNAFSSFVIKPQELLLIASILESQSNEHEGVQSDTTPPQSQTSSGGRLCISNITRQSSNEDSYTSGGGALKPFKVLPTPKKCPSI